MATTLTNSPAVGRAIERLKSLQIKHHVRRLARGMYEVTSGRSGQVYRVDLAAMRCDCAAGQLGRLCDHKIAANSMSRAMQRAISRRPARTIGGRSIPVDATVTARGEVILNGYTI
ncbi:MAG: hypothetical protein ACO24O_07180 [Arenimonas sp.]